eukprot:Gregarina_sp_Poly_1__3306@NODE_194_length_11600_cov_132_592994_g173_i0_p4_GENE_NODE_194_length_11600_cov_132_592994_g173_i0NODE_194_length_11600_cov_132_592994_g173_i0_p4_ORF_typecomplete_len415_score43_55DMT_YdcZ/PF04657_13/5_1e07DMT_YdcZ/PF04657_13/2_2e11ArgoL2/PF16488_5/4_7ArgoL2/PF16488_5/1_8e02Ca_hom_mod/PF14798_6/3_9e02Ca_hom_mod/PF14798_6/0_44_NODE_194_length_11600_cov_132_592994_g173_i042765520
MPENRTQTCLAAWPTPAELGYPLWLLNALPWVCGILTAMTLAATFRLAILWESIWWAATGSAIAALWIAWLIALVIPGASLSRALRGAISGVKGNWSLCFMFMGGPFLGLSILGVIISVQHIGIGFVFLFFCAGCLAGSLFVDLEGIGWNAKQSASLLYLPGLLLFLFGLCLISHTQILSAQECVTSLESFAICSLVALLAGAALPFQNAANGEVEKFLGTPWRTCTVSLLLTCVLLIPLALLSDGSVALFTNLEIWILLLISGLGLVILLSLGLLISPQLGSTKSSGWSVFSFSLSAVPLYYFDMASLPARVLDIPTLAGLGVMGLAALILHFGSSRANLRNRVLPPPKQFCEDDPSCEICVRNDQELFVAADEYDIEPWVHQDDCAGGRTAPSPHEIPDAHSPTTSAECRLA